MRMANGLVLMTAPDPFVDRDLTTSARARTSFICGTLVTTIKSTRASATRRIPHRAKGDWGRAKVGDTSYNLPCQCELTCVTRPLVLRVQTREKRTIFMASPSRYTRSESVMTSGDLVRYTARTKRKSACA